MLKKRKPLRLLTTVSLVTLMMLLNACASLSPKQDAVRVNLSNLKVLDSTLFEQRFEASIRIQNRTQTELNINGLSYDLALNDKDFASGVSDQKTTIAPLSEGVITVNLTSTLFSFIRQFQSMQERQSKPFTYQMQGKIFTENDLFGIGFIETGEIDMTSPNQGASEDEK